MGTRKFDLIVIGSGSGLDVAVAAAENGLKVAIVEDGRLGGTCLNRGCIPSKMLIYSADLAETLGKMSAFGIDISGYKVNFSKIIDRVKSHVDRESRMIERGLRSGSNPVLFKAGAKFIGAKTLKAGEKKITADKIIIATGARPLVPDIPGLRRAGYITSEGALRLRKLPRVMTIIGGGYIGVELAHFYGSLGTRINIVHRNDVLINREDREIAERFTDIFKRKYGVYTNYEPVRVSKNGKLYKIDIKSTKGRTRKTLRSDQLLVAVGIASNSDLLDIGKTRVKTDKNGFIQSNRYLETNAGGIYAIGDATGRQMFKHKANYDAEHVYQRIVNGRKVAVEYRAMPHGIFSSPRVAGVGKTEEELKASKVAYGVGRYNYIDTARGMSIDDKEGFVKILLEKRTGRILGCHIIGTDAECLIEEVIVAMNSGRGTIENIRKSTHIHPALTEVVGRAADNIG